MDKTIIKPVVLVILDGWGIRKETLHNAIKQAHTPWYDSYIKQYPFTQLAAAGSAVGLPEGQIGNSEVGHTIIGTGRIPDQDLVRIHREIKSGAFADTDAFKAVFTHVKKRNSQLHIIGLLSPGGVHSHEDHFFATILAAVDRGVQNIVLHPFLDGRDSPQTAGFQSLRYLEKLISRISGCHIGSVIGRYFAMDRDTNWDRTEKAFAAIFRGQADHIYEKSIKPSQIVAEWYHGEIFDEHLEPLVFKTNNEVHEVKTGDGIVFTNFRKDRARQLSQKISSEADKDLCFVTLTEYGQHIDAYVAYKPMTNPITLGSLIARAGLSQAHIAETEKFPHITYYINGGQEKPYFKEEQVLIPSRKDVKTHDQAPQMRAKEITDAAISRLTTADFLCINYANVDMVAHSANQIATIAAVETVDQELGKLVKETIGNGGAVLVIADHGNAEMMVDSKTHQPHTAHTTNPVPCIFIHESYHPPLRQERVGLVDVAPTILDLFGLPKPPSMTGKSLLMK